MAPTLPVHLAGYNMYNVCSIGTTALSTQTHAQRSSGRALEGLDFIEGLAGPGPGGEKFVAHKEWTKEPFTDDFDDEDLE